MSHSIKSLGLDRLTVAEKRQLAEELWDEVAAEVESRDIPQSHKDLLDRRLAAHHADPRSGFTWEEMQTQMARTIGESE